MSSPRSESQKVKVQAIGALSPIQEGMLYHVLRQPRPGMYVSQVSSVFHGRLDPDAFRRAWRRILDRHSALRTVFLWEQTEEPVQVVLESVPVPLAVDDWSALEAGEAHRRARDLGAEERRRGFDLTRPPLLRLRLVRLPEERWFFAWTYHHLVLDGWSEAVVLGELFRLYPALERGADLELPAARPYGDYVAWLKGRDLAAAQRFWRRSLGGLGSATLPPPDAPPDAAGGSGEIHRRLDGAVTAALGRLASGARLTLNSVVQGAWATLLAHAAGEDDVIYGMTVAGRPAELAGVETMVGLFINTLPVRTHVPRSGAALPWLHRLQELLGEVRRFEFSPLVEVQGWSDVPRGEPLFETIFVFQNTPADTTGAATARRRDLEIEEGRFQGGSTNYPLSIDVEPDERLQLTVTYDRSRFRDATAEAWAEDLAGLLEALAADPGVRFEDLRARLAAAADERRRRRQKEASSRSLARLARVRRRTVATPDATTSDSNEESQQA